MSKAWSKGSTWRWRQLRGIVLRRDGYRCMLAIPGIWKSRTGVVYKCLGVANSVHHLDGKRQGDDISRMVAACMPCNQRVGDVSKGEDPPGRAMTRW